MSNQSNIFGKPLVWESVFTNVFRNIFEMNRSAYSVLGFEPGLVLDFDDDYYRIGDFQRPFPTAITHTRASTATYVDADGILQTAASGVPRIGHHVYNGSAWVNEGLLHESEARTNLLTYSSQFDNATWTKFNATVTANDAVSPDGSATADKLIPTATNTASHYAYATISPSVSTAYNTSIYAKAGGYDILRLDIFDTTADLEGEIRVDLSDGAIISHTGGYLPSVENVGNGWYRISYSRTMAATLGTSFFRVFAFADSLFSSFAGDGTSGIYLWGAQLEAGPTPSSLIVTSGATATRAAETLTIPAANLPWPLPRVIGPELVTNGTFDTDISGWTDASSAGGSIAWNPAGYLDLVNTTAASRADQSVGSIQGKVYQVSFTNVTGGLIQLFEQENVSPFNARLLGSATSTGNVSIIWVQQYGNSRLSFRNFTTGTTVSLDNISVREINPLAVSIQMDGRVTYADLGINNQHLLYRWVKDANNNIQGNLETDAGTGDIEFIQAENSVYDIVQKTSAYNPGVFVSYNIASRHGSTFLNGAVDGVALTADTTPVALPDLSATNLQPAYNYNGTIRTFRMWSQDITDAGLEEATEPSLVPSLSLTFDGTENSFIVEDWTE